MNFEIKGAEIVIKGLQDLSVRQRAAAFAAMAPALKKLRDECERLLGLDDHTLKQLADMGHPYGFSHPQIIHQPDVSVHRQDDDLYDGLKVEYPHGLSDQIIKGRVYNDDPKDKWIQGGTTLMRGRPYMKYVEEHYGPEVAQYIIDAILRATHG